MANVVGSNLSETINAADGVSNGADTIFGFGGDDLIFGLGGNDMIKGGGGADTIDGGAGFDTVNYTDSAQGVIVSLAIGQGFNGTATGDTYSDVEHVTGSYHADDMLVGGVGADYIEGAEGIDTADYGDSSAGVTINLAVGAAAGGHATGDQLDSVENVTGSAFADTLVGDGLANVLDGGGGNDALAGGLGNDTYFVDSLNDVVTELAGQGNDTVYASVFYQLGAGSSIEFLATTNQNGTDAINFAGNDLGQTISGNAGDNVLNAYGGFDIVNGHGGNDTLYGGAGVDFLNGGAGNDAFVFEPGQAQGDTVMDFIGNGDAAGDTLVFIGYGPGATFTQINATQWQVNYNGDTSHDIINFLNGGASGVHLSDVVFL